MPTFSECWRCGNTVGVGTICHLCGIAKYCSDICQQNDKFRHDAECIPASILKTCKACTKSGSNLKVCTGCYQAFYCDANCQRSNWKRHKIDCKGVKKKIKTFAQRILTDFGSIKCLYYYWGTVPAFDCLNLVENEGEDYSSALNILFLGVGDLRNVALTCASLPDSYSNKLLFTLNDNASCVLARVALFLYMLIKGDSGVEKMITELWYSISLSESTYKYLTKTLEKLINIRSSDDLKSGTSGSINIEEKHLKKLQDVWKNWLHLRVQGTDWIQRERVDFLRKLESTYRFKSKYIQSIPKQHASTARKWLEDSDFRRTHMEMPAFAENPTLTGYDRTSRDGPYSYAVEWAGPLCGWDYVQTKKFKDSTCLVTMFGDYIEHILRKFKNKLSKQQVSFQVVLCDCMDIKQHLQMNTLCDRILTSNLMDHIILPALLKLCSEILNHSNNCATIITETIMWRDDICATDLSQASKADEKQYPDFENDHPSVEEHIDDSCDFYNYLRALFYAYQSKKGLVTECTFKQLKVKELGKEFQLRLRDCFRNENKIVFFKLSANRRSVNDVDNDQRFLEWIPLHKE